MNAQLVLENVGVRLPNRLLFEKINWTLYEGMRVSLAGRNGTGKSTLLRIMAGQGETSEGTCTVVGGRKLRIGFLDQTLLEKAVESLGDSAKSTSAMSYLMQRLEHRLEEEEETAVEWEVGRILHGLGFSEEQRTRPMSELSGGWLLRVFIALALLQQPEVLLLDEPTNHLDISSIQWLEEFLREEYKGSIVLVTHDVELQKRTTDSLAILHGGRFFYRKHQQDYLTFKESLKEEAIHVEKAMEGLDKKIEENLEFARRFKAKAGTAARAQSKIKTAEALQQEHDDLKQRLESIRGFGYNLHFAFRSTGGGSKFPISFKDVSFRYADDMPHILKHVSTDVKRGQIIAIMGENGAGKTTLLNVTAGRKTPSAGEVTFGSGSEVGYFGQHQLEELMLDSTVLDNLAAKAKGVGIEQMRGWLGAFGFGGNTEIEKKAKVLSGGEKARLALLRIVAQPINIVLLDEPTNHLDYETKALLKNAIKNFDGTTMLVSHDRDFITGLADRIIYLTTDHKMTDHIGDLDSFFAKYPQFVRHLDPGAISQPAKIQTAASLAPKANVPQLSFEERKKVKNAIKSLEKKVALAETEIERLSNAKSDAAALVTSPQQAAQVVQIETSLNRAMSEWERMTSELEVLRQKMGITSGSGD